MKSVTESVKNFILETFGKDAQVIAVIPIERGWQVTVEMLMDEDYTLKRGRNDLLYVFELVVDSERNVVSYERTGIRERGKLLEE